MASLNWAAHSRSQFYFPNLELLLGWRCVNHNYVNRVGRKEEFGGKGESRRENLNECCCLRFSAAGVRPRRTAAIYFGTPTRLWRVSVPAQFHPSRHRRRWEHCQFRRQLRQDWVSALHFFFCKRIIAISFLHSKGYSRIESSYLFVKVKRG